MNEHVKIIAEIAKSHPIGTHINEANDTRLDYCKYCRRSEVRGEPFSHDEDCIWERSRVLDCKTIHITKVIIYEVHAGKESIVWEMEMEEVPRLGDEILLVYPSTKKEEESELVGVVTKVQWGININRGLTICGILVKTGASQETK